MSATRFQELHPDQTLNFMLNRMAGDISHEEMREFSAPIEGLDAWCAAALSAGDKAETEGRHKEASAYYRGAEFFLTTEHSRKLDAFDRFMTNFEKANPEVSALRTEVPYQGGMLPVIDLPAEGTEKDVIVGCSGFDGLIEEMLGSMRTLAKAGYRVILYAGPGQGAALRHAHLHMPREWEKPVATVLDHFDISTCTLLGLSLGGYLAPRAAAFEQRANRLIAWGPMFDFFGCIAKRMGEESFEGLKGLLTAGERDVVNELVGAMMETDSTAKWAVLHGMHVSGTKDPFSFYTWMSSMNLRDVADKITQDTLILGASHDHLVPVGQLWELSESLTSAKSVTARLFTEAEGAGQHCQVGNPDVAVQEILRWLGSLDERDSSLVKDDSPAFAAG